MCQITQGETNISHGRCSRIDSPYLKRTLLPTSSRSCPCCRRRPSTSARPPTC
ncbi:MAG: hypothetical protein OZSIB_4031 [Candidatus Ozemobacter sibiricus]|uniref:Uncharacterized protein n=1 Tax=Candidatus Ozemobacter sibiricus TaxID=2268124 RepID=A0A367ZPX3_9BACT|nr:MAG: hypothetical protein OZSIB_4031 [Candidatus Ozemobacter sibiricus]